MEVIIATKGNQTKPFTKYAWELLGADKGGWEILKTQIAPNEVVTPPDSGTKKSVTNQIAKNEVEEKKDQIVVNEVKGDKESNQDNADEFNELAKKIKTGLIKDYLDINSVKYKQKDSQEKLIELLSAHLNNDVESLKKEFSL